MYDRELLKQSFVEAFFIKQFCYGKFYELIQIRNLHEKSHQKRQKLTLMISSIFAVGQGSEGRPMNFRSL